MEPKSDQGARADPISKDGVYPEFAKSSYAEKQDLDGATQMPVAIPFASETPNHVGSSPIRWAWWAGAGIVGLGLWWAIVEIARAL